MILKSIKWRLQLWYGLILVAVLVGFGVTAYQLEHGRVFRRIDEESRQRVDMLVRTMHGGPPGRGGHRGNFEPGQPSDPPPGPPNDFPEDGQPGRDFNGPPKFELPPMALGLFGSNSANGFYFIIIGHDGNEVSRSSNVPDDPGLSIAELSKGNQRDGGESGPRPAPVWIVNGHRNLLQHLPSGETILIGCSIASEVRELNLIALELAGVGGGILILGLAGGWWFVRRALRPISEISLTAARISAGDLSQRINSEEAESELGQLAAVLNSTFARLEAAFAQQQQFASDAAHELRTPVTVILTQTQLALGRERDAASYKQTVEACQRAAQRMRKLIESLLELARFDAGQEVMKRLKFDFSKTVADCVGLVQPLAEERQVKTVTELEAVEIIGDSERLAQVITNLLTNAIQYNRAEGEVRIKLAGQGGLAVLEISDTGRGIAPGDLPRIFERFYRADKSRTGNGNSGLGLSICKAIIEAHGGTIEASSVEDVGTTFTVRLPRNV